MNDIVKEDVVRMDDDVLIAEFAATGLDKRFLRVARGSQTGFAIEALHLVESGGVVALQYQREERGYNGGTNVSVHTLERFATRSVAEPAKAAVQAALGIRDALNDGTDLRMFHETATGPRRTDWAALIMGSAVAIALLVGSSGLFLGGLALFRKFYI